jgi:predicted dehydrogenase
MKVKVIGAGSIGNHLTYASRKTGWTVTVVDRDPEALRRMKTEIYPKRYGAWDESICLATAAEEPRGGFDIICIGTPPDVRMELAVAALQEQPRVLLLEKPLCTPSLAGLARFLEEYQAQAETVALVGYNHAVSESVSEVLGLLDQRKIGIVETVDVEFREHWRGIFEAHPWLPGPEHSYLGFWNRGGGAGGEHSHALHLWQLFARQAGLGQRVRVSALMDMRNDHGGDYDAVAAFTLMTDTGKIGRVIQDVITQPPRKWARIQGSDGFIEWICNGHPQGDVVRFAGNSDSAIDKVFKKTRAHDFYLEILHIQNIIDRKVSAKDSPISLESGVAVMELLAAAHQDRNHLRKPT